MSVLDDLASRRLLVVTGKGGVGKSALTAAIGRCLAARRRRTLVLEVDPRENLHQLLDVPPSGGDVVEVDRHFFLQNLKPREVTDWVVRKQVKVDLLVQRVLRSPVYHRFVEGAPGLKEMAILGHAMRLVRGDMRGVPALDTVVLDAPATGHGMLLLGASRIYADSIGHGPFADLARDVADFTADAEKSGVVIVTLAEEMPVQEAIELRDDLAAKHGREPEILVVNGVYPEYPEAAGVPSDDRRDLAELWRRRRDVNERELRRLERRWTGPVVELPLLPVDRGSVLVDRLADTLEAIAGGRAA